MGNRLTRVGTGVEHNPIAIIEARLARCLGRGRHHIYGQLWICVHKFREVGVVVSGIANTWVGACGLTSANTTTRSFSATMVAGSPRCDCAEQAIGH